MGKQSQHNGQIVPAESPEITKQHRGGGGGGSGSGAGGWMVVDSWGRSTVLNVEKQTIMHRLSIHARDMRILDPLLSYPSAILVRESTIILNLEVSGFVVIVNSISRLSSQQRRYLSGIHQMKMLSRLLSNFGGSYLFRTLMLMLKTVDNSRPLLTMMWMNLHLSSELWRSLWKQSVVIWLPARTAELENAAYPALDELTYKVNSRNLDQVRKIKSAMTRLTTRVQKARDELEQLLDDDDDMAQLYLSRKLVTLSSPSSKSGAKNWFPNSPTIGSRISKASRMSVIEALEEEDDVEELEMLLEAYFSQIDGTLNKLIALELFLNAGMLAISIFSLVTAIFGMNIPYTWNDGYPYMFQWVLVVSGIVSISIFACVISYARYKGLLGS